MGKIQQQTGKGFEKEMLAYFKKLGFWAYKLPTGCGGTAFDLIASKHGRSFAFECKTVEYKEKISYTQELQKKTPELDFYEAHGGPLFLAVRFRRKAFVIPWFEAKRLFLEQGFVELTDMKARSDLFENPGIK